MKNGPGASPPPPAKVGTGRQRWQGARSDRGGLAGVRVGGAVQILIAENRELAVPGWCTVAPLHRGEDGDMSGSCGVEGRRQARLPACPRTHTSVLWL